MSTANVTWGAPRIRNELAKLGIALSPTTVTKYMVRRRKPASPTWGSFLDNHIKDLIAVDFFVVPTATFDVLFVFLVLAHDRRRVVHSTSPPTRAPNGPRDKSCRPSRRTLPLDSCSATETESMAMPSGTRWKASGSTK
jgi:hypothetical protein